MPRSEDTASERTTLIYRHYERLYRLALLVAGDETAATTLVQSAYRQLPAEPKTDDDIERYLIRALLDQRVLRRARWSIVPPDLAYTSLDHTQVVALLRALAALSPDARLAIGLAYINGSTPAEIDMLLDSSPGAQAPSDALGRFRLAAARAVGLVPAAADDAALTRVDRLGEAALSEEEALALRRDLIAQPHLRDLRDGMRAVRELLPRALPALFAAQPPPALIDRLLELAQAERPATQQQFAPRRAQLLLAAAVLTLAAAIILLPSLLARLEAPSAARAPTVSELLDSAIHRFDRAPLKQGVLHEQYRVERAGRGAFIIERWYDYATPNRLTISVSREGREGAPLLQIGTDGQSLVQLRYGRSLGFGEQPLDIEVAPEEARQLVPLLRSTPQPTGFGRSANEPSDPGPQFLAQARALGASYLGQTSVVGRPAFLLTYQTDQPPTAGTQATPGQPVRVLISIDTQTYALLDVAVVAAGEAESTAQHPLQAQQIELLASAPDTQFTLPSNEKVGKRSGMASVRFPFIENSGLISIDDAAQQAHSQILAPLKLPDDHMRGLAVRNTQAGNDDLMLVYEGEFQNIVVLPNFNQAGSQELGAEQVAGAFRYRLVARPGSASGLAALVYRPEAPNASIGLILNDDFATPTEREATLRELIQSLTPINEQSLPVLRRNFQMPTSAAGGV